MKGAQDCMLFFRKRQNNEREKLKKLTENTRYELRITNHQKLRVIEGNQQFSEYSFFYFFHLLANWYSMRIS